MSSGLLLKEASGHQQPVNGYKYIHMNCSPQLYGKVIMFEQIMIVNHLDDQS